MSRPSGLRVLVPGAALDAPGPVGLPAEETRHLRVRRLRAGDPVVLLDGAGGRAEAILEEGLASARVVGPLPPVGEPDVFLRLILPCAEPARVEWAIEKGTECGAGAFVLVRFERSQRSHAAALASRLERLRRIAAEAVKQCGRTRVPAVQGPTELASALAAPGWLLIAEPGAPLARESALEDAPEASVVIGPEGGLDPAEREAVRRAGGRPIGLGPRVLRLETAVAAALARLLAS